MALHGDARAKALSGPGLPARTAGATTVAQFADDNFPGRMSRFCGEVVGDADAQLAVRVPAAERSFIRRFAFIV